MPASSNRNIKYQCTRCGASQARDDLTVKRVSFQTMGIGFKTLRSRNVDWLCTTCRENDPAWNAPKLSASPGMADTRIAVADAS